jgi:hypothetical protein
MAHIFISYRRRDSAYVAIDVRDALQQRFGADSVFFDIDNIPFGADFRKYIGDAVGQCDVLLVLIGDQWFQSADDHGRRRIDDPADYVRIEIESALKRNIPVVPVLVGEAKMPGASELPESIREMVFRNATEIRATRDQKNQIERLVSGLVVYWRAKVSDAEGEKPAAVEEEKLSVLEPRETIARPKTRKVVKPNPQVTKSAPPTLAPVISKAELDRRAVFLKQVRKAFEGAKHSSLWFTGAIPPEKASAAMKAYAPDVSQDAIMVLHDFSTFGGAKRGFLLTVDAIFWRNLAAAPDQCRYADIHKIELTAANNVLINSQEEIVLLEEVALGVINLVRRLRPKLQTASQPDLDQRAAFLKQVRKAFKGIRSDKVWFSGAIPPEKANAATKAYAPKVSPEAIMLLYDDTIWGGAKDGLLLTVDAIYWHSFGRKMGHCRYADIQTIRVGDDGHSNTTLLIDSETITFYYGPRKIAQALMTLIRSLKTHVA